MLDRVLTFGRYRLEPRGGLMSGAREVRLTPKALALLVLPRRTPRRGDHEGRVVWRRVAGNHGRRRGARHLHPGAAPRAARRCPQAPLHRDTAPARLPVHREDHVGAPTGRVRQRGSRPAAARPPLDRGAAVRQHERRCRSGALCRRHVRGPDHRAVPHPLAVRHRPQLDLRLQAPRGRRQRGLTRARRAIRARRQRTPRRQQAARQRAAGRCDDRRPSLGRTLRPRARRHLRRAGRHHPQRRGGDRAATAGRGGRSRDGAFRRRSRGLGACGARANPCLPHGEGGLRDGDRHPQAGRRGLSGLRTGAKPAGVLPRVCRAYGVDRSPSGLASGNSSTQPGPLRSTIAIPGGTSRSAIRR